MAKIHELRDRFDSALTALWGKSEVSAGSDVTFSGGRLNIRFRNGYPFYETLTTYDMTNSRMYVELVSHPGPVAAGSDEVILMIGTTDGLNSYGFYVTGNPLQLSAHYRVGTGTWSSAGAALTYVNATHRWLSIQHTGSTINWDTSTNGTVWTNRWTRAASAFDHTAVGVRIQSGDWNADNLTAAVWDNFNTTPGRQPRRRPTRFFNRNF